MSVVALCLPLVAEELLASTAVRYGHRVAARCSGADELAARVAALAPEVVVAQATPQYLSAALVAACDAAGVRVLAIADDAAQRGHAASLGFADPVPGPADWAVLAGRREAVPGAEAGGATDGLESAPVRPARGQVVVVWGAAGAPGRTSLAIAIAAELALRGGLVALADADTHAASLAPALGLLDEAPGFAAACRLAGADALTRDELERVAEWVPLSRSGMWALTGLGRPSRWPELTAERVAGALRAMRDWVGTTVVDVAGGLEEDEELSSDLRAPRRNAATLAALAEADRVVAVGAADPVGVARLLRGHAELLGRVDPDRVSVVLNKVRASAIGLDPRAQLRQTLARFGGIDDPAFVPWDPAALDSALLSGRPLPEAAPRSPARAAIRDLVVARIAGVEPDPARRSGARRRLLSRARLA